MLILFLKRKNIIKEDVIVSLFIRKENVNISLNFVLCVYIILINDIWFGYILRVVKNCLGLFKIVIFFLFIGNIGVCFVIYCIVFFGVWWGEVLL